MNSSLRDSLRVVSPNGGEQWTAASTRTIRWTFNEVDNISLEYTLDDGVSWKTIADNIPASRLSYDWEVPVTPSYTCRIRIKDIGRDIHDQSDAVSRSRIPLVVSVLGRVRGNTLNGITGIWPPSN